ncbi:tripartite tricarboxylate transporter permease [Halalkalibacter krulwichiae]|uniref:tripartite tricarboxylate transporter permease n=1 Tax=Halalkalibacter krulwichiae TaxID=199441 RepID=UPI00082474F4|nr:tripartite tricarboxylate transporter permease [Halalkalibacter krulwichiae]
MLEAAHEALLMILDPNRLVFMFLGIAIGLTLGIMPGLSGTVGMAILLPFVYGMDPFTGMALLIGMAAVLHTGDTFPSVLLGVPGSSGSQATIMDGHPMAQKGESSKALGAAFFASMIGGVIGGVALFLSIPIVRPLVLAFGSPELFMLSLLGLSMVGVLAGKFPIRGVIAGIIGLMLGSIGSAPSTPEYRYTFDSLYLSSGIPLAVFALALFAFPVIIDLLAEDRSISKKPEIKGRWFSGMVETIKHKWLVFRSAVLGAILGFIPGIGGSVVDWVSYGIAKQTVKNNESFGKGDIRGVIAPESSNNAKEGGALIPTLMFGIPGSGTTAILLGGLTLMGLQAGPRLVTTELSLTLSIVWTLIIANVIGAALCILLIKPISKLSFIQANKLMPFLLIIILLGAYQSTTNWGDLILFVVIGLLGWIMSRLDWPRAPMLIGFVLAASTERYLWISMTRYDLDWITRPGVIIIGLIILFVLVGGIIMNSRERNKKEEVELGDGTNTFKN